MLDQRHPLLGEESLAFCFYDDLEPEVKLVSIVAVWNKASVVLILKMPQYSWLL